jgi:hypothetical protein
MATKCYIRGFPRDPINTLNYAASTNFFLACADAWMIAEGADPDTDILEIEWVPFNADIYLTVFYKIP